MPVKGFMSCGRWKTWNREAKLRGTSRRYGRQCWRSHENCGLFSVLWHCRAQPTLNGIWNHNCAQELLHYC